MRLGDAISYPRWPASWGNVKRGCYKTVPADPGKRAVWTWDDSCIVPDIAHSR